MTLRRFMVLVRGLSPQSATWAHVAAARPFGAAREIDNEQDAENALAKAFGRRPVLVH